VFLDVLAWAFNPLVERSNRSRPTIHLKAYRQCRSFFRLLKIPGIMTGSCLEKLFNRGVIINLAKDYFDLNRFVVAQKQDYAIALDELTQGKKYSHWMWYIFPQIKGLGRSHIAQKYAIRNAEEARAYLAHPILGTKLIECCEVLLGLNSGYTVSEIFGFPDDLKLKSSMTLFASVSAEDSVFHQVVNQYFDGEFDSKTVDIMM